MSVSPRPHRPVHALDLSRYPNVYDAAFSWDRSREAKTFLEAAASRGGRTPHSAVELGCGTGHLARLWGSWGLEVYGVDISRSAIARAQALSRGLVPLEHWLIGDLRTFHLPRRVEVAVVPLDGLGYLLDERDVLAFFRAARRSLLPGGVLAIDLTLHPESGSPLRIRNAWNVGLRPQGNLRVTWRSEGKAWGDPPRRWEVGLIHVRLPNRPRQLFWEARPHAAFSAHALDDVARTAGGYGRMWVYSDAAHRAGSGKIHRIGSISAAVGPRLITWQRT